MTSAATRRVPPGQLLVLKRAYLGANRQVYFGVAPLARIITSSADGRAGQAERDKAQNVSACLDPAQDAVCMSYMIVHTCTFRTCGRKTHVSEQSCGHC